MTQSLLITEPDLVLTPADWGIGVTGTCTGISATWTDTDPDSVRTGLGRFKSVNDFTACGGWAGGRMSNAHATRGEGPFGSFNAPTSLPIGISSNDYLDVSLRRGAYSYKDVLTALDPNAFAKIYVDFYMSDSRKVNWGEVFICLGWAGLATYGYDGMRLFNRWAEWRAEHESGVWSGALFPFHNIYGFFGWGDHRVIPVGRWLNDWAIKWNISSPVLRGVEFGVETSGMTAECWFDKVRYYRESPQIRVPWPLQYYALGGSRISPIYLI